MIPRVAASESGAAQTGAVEAVPGLKDGDVGCHLVGELAWKGRPQGVKAAYPKPSRSRSLILSRAGPEEPCPNLAAPSAKAKYYRETDRGPVP